MKTLKLKFGAFFTIAMLILSSCSSDDDSLPVQITDPTANFTFDITVASSGEAVTFTDTSTEGSSVITAWSWTFTGATPSSSIEQNPTIVFNSKGEFSATLTVTADDGGNASTTLDILAVEGCEVYTCEKFLVDVSEDINYGIDVAHSMNIYIPKGDLRESKPALLLNGGGQYEGSDLSLLENLAERLTSYGFVVATAGYRNGIQDETGNLMRGMVDSKAAVRFLRANAIEYGIDPDQIYAGGWASGAYNALVHAYWQFEDINPPALYDFVVSQGWIENWEGEQGNQGVSSEVIGVVSLGGAMYGQEEVYKDDLWITSTDVSLFAVHGTADSETPYGLLQRSSGNWEFGSSIIHQRLLDVGISSALVTIEGGAHESPRLTENIDNYIEDLVGFLGGQ